MRDRAKAKTFLQSLQHSEQNYTARFFYFDLVFILFHFKYGNFFFELMNKNCDSEENKSKV